MDSDRLNKILLGESIPDLESDDPDVEEIEKPENALKKYRFGVVLTSIGEDDFKENYLAVINNIKNEYSLQSQILFCQQIILKIEEIYEYVPPQEIDIVSEVDVEEVFEFLEFLEYNNVDFLITVWQNFDINLRKMDINKFCKENSSKIISEIETNINISTINEILIDFLRTYNKDGLIDWFSKQTKKSSIEILLNKEGV